MEVLVDPWNVDIAVQTFMEMGAIAVTVSEEEKWTTPRLTTLSVGLLGHWLSWLSLAWCLVDSIYSSWSIGLPSTPRRVGLTDPRKNRAPPVDNIVESCLPNVHLTHPLNAFRCRWSMLHYRYNERKTKMNNCPNCNYEATFAPNLYGKMTWFHKIASPRLEGYYTFIDACSVTKS